MTLSIKNGGYAFLNEFQVLQILNDLSVRHLIKVILYENDVELLKFKRSVV